MWAFITDSFRSVVSTQRELEFLIGVYPYATWKKVSDVAEAKRFWAQNEQKYFSTDAIFLGTKDKVGYIRIEYFIANNNIYANIDTRHFGFIKLKNVPKNVIQEASYDMLRLKIQNIVLDDAIISHHCIAILNIMQLFGPYLNMEIMVPDISVYLALTKYTGTNYNIKKMRTKLDGHLGKIYWTIKGENYD